MKNSLTPASKMTNDLMNDWEEAVKQNQDLVQTLIKTNEYLVSLEMRALRAEKELDDLMKSHVALYIQLASFHGKKQWGID